MPWLKPGITAGRNYDDSDARWSHSHAKLAPLATALTSVRWSTTVSRLTGTQVLHYWSYYRDTVCSHFELLRWNNANDTFKNIISTVTRLDNYDCMIKIWKKFENVCKSCKVYLVQIYISRSLRRLFKQVFVVFYKESDIHFGITFNVYYTFNTLRELIFYWIYNCCEYLATSIYTFGLIENLIDIEYFELFSILCGSVLRVIGILRLSL